MKPHTTTTLGLELLGELVSLVEASPKLKGHRSLARLATSAADLLEVAQKPDLPRSQAMRAAMRVAADGAGRVELMALMRAIKVIAAKSNAELIEELVSESPSRDSKKKARRRRRVESSSVATAVVVDAAAA